MPVTLDDLLTQPVDSGYYLSWPLIPRGGRILLGAPTKHFKSMLALNLAYDMAEGLPLLGLMHADGSPLWPVKRPLTVLYAEKEIGKYRLQERMRRIHAIRKGVLAPENLFFEPKGNGIMLDTEYGTNLLKERLDQCRPDILVIDPLRKFHSCDEDSSTEMVKVVYRLDDIQKQYKDLTTIILHHTGKRSEFRSPTDPESLRGSSLIFDDCDTAIMLDRPVKTNINVIRLNFVLRSAADPLPQILQFDPETFVFGPRKKE